MRASVVSCRRCVTRMSSAPYPLIVPANTSSPADFSTGSDSPVIGAWLTGLAPDTTTPSSGIFSPGLTSRTSASRTSSTAHARLLAVAAHDGFGRRQVHQRAYRVPRAIHAARLENLREREQERDRRAFGPLADDHRADDGDEHQHVDVERHDARRRPRAARRVDAARQNRDEVSAANEQRAEDRGTRNSRPAAKRGARCDDERLARGRGSGVADRRFVLEPRAHAGLRDRLDDRRRRQLRGVVPHAQPLPDEVGHDVLEPGQRFQPALENRDFLAAIHAVDLEDRLGVDLADGARDLLICQFFRGPRSASRSRARSARPRAPRGTGRRRPCR